MGWDLLFIASIINLVYGIVVLFTDYGSIANLFWSIVGTAIGWYFLFQIREYYLGKKPVEAKKEEKVKE